eukprot:TRINITY_DN4379_c0_g1_i1.p1 TRINITY_DN4379_c0_g1~~TRINITY_DN4379_c0_g1_i1.p1  ORF type:complete len:753 (+),score=152.45 TRINITY_DN4379_c0_g1_i1:209-2260(+)
MLPGATVYFGKHWNDTWYLNAGTDAARASDFNAAWADPNVKMILPERGGWGWHKILPYVNWTSIALHPKLYGGYSDSTSMIFAMYIKTGIRAYYHSMGTDDWGGHETYNRPFSHWNMYYMTQQLVNNQRLVLSMPSGYVSPVWGAVSTIGSGGKARGLIVGEHIPQITSLFGTEYIPDPTSWFKGKVMILDIVSRMPVELDMLMAQMKIAGALDGITAFVWGDFFTGSASNGDIGPDPTTKSIITSYVEPLHIPAFGGAFLGHTNDNGQWHFPFAANVEVDADAFTITMLEDPVNNGTAYPTTTDGKILTDEESWSLYEELDAIIPGPLSGSATFAIISPSSPIIYEYTEGDDWRAQSFKSHAASNVAKILPKATVKFGDNYNNTWYYCAGTDKERAADFNAAWADSDVQVILPSRGGWGALRMLPYVNWDTVRHNPKIFIGSDDSTTLLFAIYVKTGIRPYYGALADADWGGHESHGRNYSHYNADYLRNMLVDNKRQVLSNPAYYKSSSSGPAFTIVGGTATGILVGGNIRQIAGLMGTEYLPRGFFKGKILLIEMDDRQPRELDLLMATFLVAGYFDELAGVIWGDSYNTQPSNGNLGVDPTTNSIMEYYLSPLSIPSYGGAFFGGTTDDGQWAFPFGAKAKMDADAKTVTILEDPMNGTALRSLSVLALLLSLVVSCLL